ncbi:MAG: Uncharacterized protein CEO21_206 [Microgenomates group bacterium Gr01-1014_80]|nr:MAG: Uncharacterized protein CEO21_206 [Microgenomates group bacterium Gr01-1014_80]
MFFSSKVLLYVRKNKLEVFLNGKRDEVEFPPKVFQNIEILDSGSFEKLVGEFLAGMKLSKKKAVILLSDEITFHKSIPAVEADKVATMTQTFLDSVPFDPQTVALKKLQSGDQILLLATNKEVYEILLRVTDNLDWKILSVIPLTVFKEKLGLSDDVLDSGVARRILSDKKLITLSDFLSSGVDKPQKNGSPLTAIVIFIFVLLIISGLTFEAIKLGVIKNPVPYLKNLVGGDSKKAPEKKVSQEGTSSAEEKSSSHSASLPGDAWERGDAKVQVLNGSGVAGQAAKVRDILVELGYDEANIELGNATGSGETVVIFSKKVPGEIRDELIAELEKTFADVTMQEDTADNEFDVIITTGLASSQ